MDDILESFVHLIFITTIINVIYNISGKDIDLIILFIQVNLVYFIYCAICIIMINPK